MGRLDHELERKAYIAAGGVTASGSYTPTSNWEIGIPGSSAKLLFKSRWVRKGNVVTVWGSGQFSFDNSSPSFDVSVPVTNGNSFTGVTGSVRRQKNGEVLGIASAVFGGNSAIKLNFNGSGISGLPDEVWDFKIEYTLT